MAIRSQLLKHALLGFLVALPGSAFMSGCTTGEFEVGDEEEGSLATTQEALTYTTLWEDNFDGSSLNRANWNVQTSWDERACRSDNNRFNNEIQSYVDDESCGSTGNMCVSGGTLKLVVRHEPTAIEGCNGYWANYSSTRLNSKGKKEFNTTQGQQGIRIEARIKMPAIVAGSWPAFWTLGNDIKQWPILGGDTNDWPDAGEIDIAEVGYAWNSGNDTLATVHYGTNNYSSWDGEFLSSRSGGQTGITSNAWITYAAEWRPGSMTWFKDGVQFGFKDFGDMPNHDFEHPHFILLNFAMGGAGGTTSTPNSALFPSAASYTAQQVMEIDYVKVMAINNDAPQNYALNSTVQAEAGTQVGTQLENGNTTVGFFDGGDSMCFSNVTMNGITGLNMRIASANAGGVVEARLGSPTGTLIGSHTVAATGGWTTWADRSMTVSAQTGVQTLCLKGAGTTAGIMNIDQFVLTGGGGCTPTTCTAQGKNCDTIPDGCGGTLSCGSCTAPATCGGGGTANVCGTSTSYSVNSQVQAEAGVQTGTQLENGNTTVGYFDGGDSICVANVNMAGVTGLNMRIASANAGGVVEARLGSATGTLIGSHTVASTGGWTTWADRSMSVSAQTGVQTLCLKGAGTTAGIMNIDFFTLTGGTADTQVPTTPGSLASSNITSSAITLSWGVSTDNVGVTGYRVYRGTTDLGTTTATSYTFTGLTASTAYTLKVRAFDAAGNLSGEASTSATTSAPPSDTTVPSTPGGLATSNITSTAITMSWSASTDNVGVTGYRIYR
ncbi:MAG TPA: carbohydrate-binding protein, partial [Polyangiaceae bacterium]|nr:carbohydrate-binding protein [Polyangiaceae bacterium]